MKSGHSIFLFDLTDFRLFQEVHPIEYLFLLGASKHCWCCDLVQFHSPGECKEARFLTQQLQSLKLGDDDLPYHMLFKKLKQ